VRRRFRSGSAPGGYLGRLTDENGEPITIATPGAPTQEECRRYAQAVQRATTPPPLTAEQQAEVDAIHRRNRELFPHLYNDWHR